MADVLINGNVYRDVPAVDLPNEDGQGNTRFFLPSEILYAGSPTSGGPANCTNGIHYAQVDTTSTSTVFTATIQGITSYYDGLTVMLKNGVVTSASGCTLNINNLGAKPIYSSMAAATRDTTIFNINYTMMFVYDSTRVAGGCWVCYRGYNSDTNTIAYIVRMNSSSLPVNGATYRYRLLFEAMDGAHYVPANTSTSTNGTAARAVNQTPINPFGKILYYNSTSAIASGSRPGASALCYTYQFVLGYSFNVNGSETLTAWKPCYLKCAPQSDGSAIMDASTPIVQDLPNTNDGKIYIFLGIAYDTTHLELHLDHPIYYHDGTNIKLWWGNSGSSSGGEMVVTISGSSGSYSSNKSFDEIATAISNGESVSAVVTSDNNRSYCYSYSTSSAIIFSNVTVTDYGYDNSSVNEKELRITKSGSSTIVAITNRSTGYIPNNYNYYPHYSFRVESDGEGGWSLTDYPDEDISSLINNIAYGGAFVNLKRILSVNDVPALWDVEQYELSKVYQDEINGDTYVHYVFQTIVNDSGLKLRVLTLTALDWAYFDEATVTITDQAL